MSPGLTYFQEFLQKKTFGQRRNVVLASYHTVMRYGYKKGLKKYNVPITNSMRTTKIRS